MTSVEHERRTADEATVAAIEQRVETLDVENVIAKALGSSAGNSRESPASIPDR